MVYNFNNQNLVTFEDNFKSKGDLPFALYFDFETTAPTDNYFDPEQTKMLVVCYAALEVNAGQCKNALAQMFTIETAFVKKKNNGMV